MFDTIAEIILSIPIDQTYTYGIPNQYVEKAVVGARVRVQFRGREEIGIIWSLSKNTVNEANWFSQPTTGKDYEISPISSYLESEKVAFCKVQLDLVKSIYQIYQYPLGRIFHLVYPSFREHSSMRKSKNAMRNLPPLANNKRILAKSAQLNEEQQANFDQILHIYHNRKFQKVEECLLHGVTGSGKTEVYIRLFHEVLRAHRSVLYMVPEIAITIQLAARLKEYFAKELILFHSALTPRKRYQNYLQIISQKAALILGTRSAIFLPIQNLSLIVIDEEHDQSFKEQHFPPLDARVLAKMRAKNENAVIVMGSATPRIETVYASHVSLSQISAATPTIHYLSLRNRYGGVQLPKVELIGYQNKKERDHGMTSRTLENIEKNLKKGKKNLLLFNRRGYYRSIYDRNDKGIRKCPHCSVSLILHKNHTLRCHYCQYSTNYQRNESDILSTRGIQQTEIFLTSLFPSARLVRVDSDKITSYSVIQEIMNDFLNGEIDILLGTQMIAKGIDFADLDFVSVLEADSSLHFPDFRASEKTFSLLVQVAGRAGRSKRLGDVLFECLDPQIEVLQLAAKQDYHSFYQKEILERKKYNYPPFCRLIRIIFQSTNEDVLREICEEKLSELQSLLGNKIEIIGPSQAPIYKIKDQFRWHFLIKTNEFVSTFITLQKEFVLADSTVKQFIDPDPIDFF